MYSPSRNKNLDFLRGLAVLLVMAGHFLPGYISTRLGWSGVDLFFVLSGFFVSGILIREFRDKGRVRTGRFLLRRGLKIWPLFYTALLLQLAYYYTRGQFPSQEKILAEIFFLQDYLQGFMLVTWSLGVEEQFYLLLAIVFFMSISAGSPRLIPYGCMAVMAACLSFRLYHYYRINGQFDPHTHFYPLHLRADSLCAGILIAWNHHTRREEMAKWVGRNRGFLMALAALLAIPVLYYPYTDPAVFTWGFTANLGCYGLLVLLFLYPGRLALPAGSLGNRLFRGMAWTGFYSYSIYLFHLFVGVGVLSNLARLAGRPVPALVSFPLALAASIGAGYLFSRLIELPILRWRDRVLPP